MHEPRRDTGACTLPRMLVKVLCTWARMLMPESLSSNPTATGASLSVSLSVYVYTPGYTGCVSIQVQGSPLAQACVSSVSVHIPQVLGICQCD